MRHEFLEQLEDEARDAHGARPDGPTADARVDQQLREILVVIVRGLPPIVVLAAAAGYLLARRALAPIDQLAIETRRITADRVHERLSVPNQHDEIGRLAAVINETFARLEESFGQLRRFTADASHELRTPLSVIRGIGEIGLRDTRTTAEYKETIGSMLEEVDRLTSLVETLLRLSYADAGTVRPVLGSHAGPATTPRHRHVTILRRFRCQDCRYSGASRMRRLRGCAIRRVSHRALPAVTNHLAFQMLY